MLPRLTKRNAEGSHLVAPNILRNVLWVTTFVMVAPVFLPGLDVDGSAGEVGLG